MGSCLDSAYDCENEKQYVPVDDVRFLGDVQFESYGRSKVQK